MNNKRNCISDDGIEFDIIDLPGVAEFLTTHEKKNSIKFLII
jgi:hypothetical protein